MKRTSQVLLVDDNPADIDLTSDCCRRRAYPSTFARDGRSGGRGLPAARGEICRHASGRIWCLLDLNLPRKDGRAVLAEVKADPDCGARRW